MEPGDTSGMALWHPAKQQWSKKVIEAIDPHLIEKLPPVKPADQTIGNIAPHLAEKFGFDPACKIDAGSGDNMYGAIGTGNVQPGIVTISLGTSGTAYSFMEQPFIDPEGEIAAFCDATGHYLPLLCVSNLANGYNLFLKQFNLSHQQFNELLQKQHRAITVVYSFPGTLANARRIFPRPRRFILALPCRILLWKF